MGTALIEYDGRATVSALRKFCAEQSGDRYVAFVIEQGVPLVRVWDDVPPVAVWGQFPGGYWHDGRQWDWPRA